MRVIDSVKLPDYSQWCSSFVEEIITEMELRIGEQKVETVQIVYIDGKRIYLSICGFPFIVRTWDYIPCEYDKKGKVCGEEVHYTVFLDQEYYLPDGTQSMNGEPLCSGVKIIRWSNE